MSHGIIIGEQCPYCTKFCSPLDFIRVGPVKICTACEQRHLEALEALQTGQFKGECSECGKKPAELAGGDGKMAVHFENGKYRAMCMPCDRVYVRKRRELYGGTPFARKAGID